MNKSILWLIGLLFVTSLSIVSCSETDGTEDPYANWIIKVKISDDSQVEGLMDVAAYKAAL